MVNIQETLPGLVVPDDLAAVKSDIVLATQLMIDDLNAAGVLEKRHLALCQLAADQSKLLQASLTNPHVRVTAVTGLMDSLRETLTALPEPETASRGKFEEFMASLPSRQECEHCQEAEHD